MQNIPSEIISPPTYANVLKTIPFSPTNFTQEKLPWLPDDDIENKNRRPWSQKEREQLQIDLYGKVLLRPKGFYLYIQSIENMKTVKGVSRNLTYDMKDEWQIGRVIAMAETCWEHSKFPYGARCTWNDWVIYSTKDVKTYPFREHPIVRVTDYAISDIIPDIDSLIEA